MFQFLYVASIISTAHCAHDGSFWNRRKIIYANGRRFFAFVVLADIKIKNIYSRIFDEKKCGPFCNTREEFFVVSRIIKPACNAHHEVWELNITSLQWQSNHYKVRTHHRPKAFWSFSYSMFKCLQGWMIIFFNSFIFMYLKKN